MPSEDLKSDIEIDDARWQRLSEEERIADFEAWKAHYVECIRQTRIQCGMAPDDPPVGASFESAGKRPPIGWGRRMASEGR